MTETIIQSYEDRLIAKDRSVCFYEMMQETYNFLTINKPIVLQHERENARKFFDPFVDGVIANINKGYGIKTAFKKMGKRYDKYYQNLSQKQKDKIRAAKLNQTNKTKTA